MKMISRKPVHPTDTEFTLEDARNLIEGNYHDEDDDEEEDLV